MLSLPKTSEHQNDMQTRTHIFLLGFMGAGKSYWGARLAQAKGLPFLDLDELISEQEGRSIAQLFAKIGESGFRMLERATLQKLEAHAPSVIATGGGTPCFFDNMEWMNAHGTTLFLDTSAAILAERLKHELGVRPLLASIKQADLQTFIQGKILEREPFYQKATVVLEQLERDENFLAKLLESV